MPAVCNVCGGRTPPPPDPCREGHAYMTAHEERVEYPYGPTPIRRNALILFCTRCGGRP